MTLFSVMKSMVAIDTVVGPGSEGFFLLLFRFWVDTRRMGLAQARRPSIQIQYVSSTIERSFICLSTIVGAISTGSEEVGCRASRLDVADDSCGRT